MALKSRETRSGYLVHIVQRYKTNNSHPKRINDKSPILSQQHNLSILVDCLIYPQQARQTVALAAVTLDCECGDFCHVPNVTCQNSLHHLMLSMTLTCLIYLFSFLHPGRVFMVIVQFHSHLVRQYSACVIDSLGL